MARTRNTLLALIPTLIPTLIWLACAAAPPGASQGGAPMHPPRPPRCALTLMNAPVPPLTAWDDLGKIELTCHIDVDEGDCLQRFRAEACRRGADVVYAMPARPPRPREQAYAFRGHLAHTRPTTPTTPTTPTPAPPGNHAPDAGADALGAS